MSVAHIRVRPPELSYSFRDVHRVLAHSDKVIGHFVRLGKPGRSGKLVRVETRVNGCGRFGSSYETRQKDLSPNYQNDQKPKTLSCMFRKRIIARVRFMAEWDALARREEL